ncbi:hypothetical protein BJ508DRAFT_200540, partial [Ascobolus immersus RN42]
GIGYLLTHRQLFPPFVRYIIPLVLLTFGVFFFLFAFTYIPQVAILSFFHGPLAFTNAVFIILGEGATLVAVIAENWMCESGIVDIFDCVLLLHGRSEKIAKTRELRLEKMDLKERTGVADALGKYKISPYLRFSCRLVVEYLLFFPLSFIPLVGVGLFIALSAYHLGPLAHYRYFQLKGLDKQERKAEIQGRKWRYWLFGCGHLTLQMVPVLSIFFLFTSAVGAALWAVRLEE